MDGFVGTPISPGSWLTSGPVVMGYWTRDDLPFIYSLASTFSAYRGGAAGRQRQRPDRLPGFRRAGHPVADLSRLPRLAAPGDTAAALACSITGPGTIPLPGSVTG